MIIDFNFYPEKHMDELDGMLDIKVPEGWTVGDFIRELVFAKSKLYSALYGFDEDGNIYPKWK